MNPFADRILPDPETRPAVSVQSYNREILDIIVDRLLDGLKTRNNRTQASVIISTDPGTGKTHLLSRLIDAVAPHALPVFVPPMNESRALGRAVLNRTVSRLCRMVESGRAMNQFQWLTFQLFGLSCAGYPEIAAEWREFPIDQVKEPFFQQALRERRREIETHLAAHLGNLPGKPLLEAAATWTRALLDILSNDPTVQAQAIEWIKGRMLNYPGFEAGSTRDIESMDPYEEYENSEGRLYDLTQLFGLCRPLLFIFDQVENFLTFGPEALQSFVFLIERLLTHCAATQVIVAANAADWMPFIAGANLPLAYNDRFHRARILRGMLEPEARELRDLRAGVDHLALARDKIPDSLIRSRLSIGPDGRPQRLITPRKFLSEWAQRWEGGAGAETAQVPDGKFPIPTNLAPEWEKARAVARREPMGFFPESIRTVLMEVLGAKRNSVDRYEFLLLDDIAIFLEPTANNRRWEAWAQRAEKLPVNGIRALRPAEDLSELDHLAHAPVPGAGWKAARKLHRLLETKMRIVKVGAGQMFELVAACRLMDGAADLGRTRGEVAQWLRKTLGDAWRDFLSAPAASGMPAGAIEAGAQAPVQPRDRSGIVMFSVTRLLDLLTRPDGTLTPAMSLPFRERGLLFHELACRFVRHLLERAAATTNLNDTLVAFLSGERLWQEAQRYDAEPPRIEDALNELATCISRLRDSAAGLRSWQELYISTELQVNDVLGVYDGVTVILTGRCDVLRRRVVGGPPEVVDYQLSSTGSHAVEKQLQLALYARLLSQGSNPLLCNGTLEIYSPTLREVRFTHAQLLRFFESEIEPALRKMAREARAQTSSLEQICIDTLNSPAGCKTASPGFPALPNNEGTAAIESAFEGFIGNAEAVSRIKTALADATLNSKPPVLPSNILLTGHGGLGKTELAKRIAKALGLPLVQVPGSRIAKVDDLLALVDSELGTGGLVAREEGTDSGLPRMLYPPLVIFIDEVHELRRRADRFLNMFEPNERRAVGSRHVGDFRSSTLIAATTDAGLLPKPFLTRFHPYELRAYTAREVAEILRLSGVPGDDKLREMLAIIGRLNPRIAKLHAEEFMIHHRVHGLPLDLSGLDRLRSLLGIDRLGLTARDRRYLEWIETGPAGVDALAHALQIEKEEIMRDIEPYLLQSGLITTGRNGRKITDKGRRLLRGD